MPDSRLKGSLTPAPAAPVVDALEAPALGSAPVVGNALEAPDMAASDVVLELLEEEDLKQGEGERGEEKLRRSLYQPSPDLLALSGRLIGAAIEVHSILGPGYTEVVYARALRRELRRREVPYESEVPIEVVYKGDLIAEFRIDLVIDERLVVELKAVDSITSVHVAQTLAYLKASGIRVGLIVNFNVPRLQQGLRRVTW
jgi:GxxExxY protein